MGSTGEATRLLLRLAQQEGEARKRTYDELVTLLYEDLRRRARRQLAGERIHSLQPTILVHDAYERLLGYRMPFENRHHFLNAAAEAMRRILIERARRLAALKRGRRDQALPIEDGVVVTALTQDPDMVLDIARVLESLRPEQVRLVDLRYFAGLTIQETAEVMHLKPEAVKKRWQVLKMLLFDRLQRLRRDDA